MWAGTELEGNLCYPKDTASLWVGSGAGSALREGISLSLSSAFLKQMQGERPQREENVQQKVMYISTCYHISL